MNKIKVYGASDDLIEIEGGIKEEFNWLSNTPAYLLFDDGKQLSIWYDEDGNWRIKCLNFQPISHFKDLDEDDYSEIVKFESDAKRVRLYKSPPKEENQKILKITNDILDSLQNIENWDSDNDEIVEKNIVKILKKYIDIS